MADPIFGEASIEEKLPVGLARSPEQRARSAAQELGNADQSIQPAEESEPSDDAETSGATSAQAAPEQAQQPRDYEANNEQDDLPPLPQREMAQKKAQDNQEQNQQDDAPIGKEAIPAPPKGLQQPADLQLNLSAPRDPVEKPQVDVDTQKGQQRIHKELARCQLKRTTAQPEKSAYYNAQSEGKDNPCVEDSDVEREALEQDAERAGIRAVSSGKTDIKPGLLPIPRQFTGMRGLWHRAYAAAKAVQKQRGEPSGMTQAGKFLSQLFTRDLDRMPQVVLDQVRELAHKKDAWIQQGVEEAALLLSQDPTALRKKLDVALRQVRQRMTKPNSDPTQWQDFLLLPAGGSNKAPLPEEEPPVPASSLRVGFDADLDGDGTTESHSVLVEGEGEGARLMLHSEPVLLETYLKSHPTLKPQIQTDVTQAIKLSKKAISQQSGNQIRALLEKIAKALKNAKHILPPTRAPLWTTKTINNPTTTTSERVTSHLKVEPLSLRPGDPSLTGTGVQQSNTPLMKELRKFAPYVRGHMLNSKIHGPGTDANLVPISMPMNKQMERGVEKRLKELVNSEAKVVSYEVKPQNWGNYPGGGKGGKGSVESILPNHFEMRIRTMRKKGTGGDGSQAADWEIDKTIGEENFDRKHDIPMATNFNLDAKPKNLPRGAYDINSAMYENPNHPGRWVMQGTVVHYSPLGKVSKTKYDVPTVVAAAPPMKLTQEGQQLIISDLDTSLQKDLAAAFKNFKMSDENIKNRDKEAKAKVNEARHWVQKLLEVSVDQPPVDLQDLLGQTISKLDDMMQEWTDFYCGAEKFWAMQAALLVPHAGQVVPSSDQFWAEQEEREDIWARYKDLSAEQSEMRGSAVVKLGEIIGEAKTRHRKLEREQWEKKERQALQDRAAILEHQEGKQEQPEPEPEDQPVFEINIQFDSEDEGEGDEVAMDAIFQREEREREAQYDRLEKLILAGMRKRIKLGEADAAWAGLFTENAMTYWRMQDISDKDEGAIAKKVLRTADEKLKRNLLQKNRNEDQDRLRKNRQAPQTGQDRVRPKRKSTTPPDEEPKSKRPRDKG